jgi:hypothetical protein
MKRQLPKTCPVCSSPVQTYESGRVLCTAHGCDFEWFWKPKQVLPTTLPSVNIERMKQPNLTNLEKACYILGWQGGTVHQVARKLGVTIDLILNANDIQGLINAVATTRE